MKKLLILLLFIPAFCFGQAVSTAKNSFGTLTDLRAQTGVSNVVVQLSGLTTVNDGNGGTYYWDATSVAADDGISTIQVTNVTTGRWRRIVGGNTIKGSVTFSGITLQTSYTVSYQGGTLPFTPLTVIVNPRSANAAALSYISSITSSGFTINFLTVPVLGTNNIVFDYIAVKF